MNIDLRSLLSESNGGTLLEQSNELLAQLVKDCCSTDKVGQIQITLKITPHRTKSGGHQIRVSPKVDAKNPRFDTGDGFFHVVTDENGMPVSLETEDPRQMSLLNSISFSAQEAE